MIKYLKDHTSRNERWYLLLVLVIALTLRIGYLIEMKQTLFLTQLRLDELFHRNWALSIANGNIFGDVIFFRAPLYAYWLGLNFAIFGYDIIIPRIIQHILGTISILFLYFLARKLFGKKTAVIATLILATYPPLIYIENKLLFESILIPLLIIFFTLWYYFKENPRPLPIFILGMVAGLICITRPLFLPLLLIFAIIIFFTFKEQQKKRSGLYPASIFLIAALLPIAPVTIRNYLAGGNFVLIASQGGINFYLGNNPSADGFSATLPGPSGNRWGNIDMEQPVAELLGRKPTASEIDNYWRSKAFEFIINSPAGFLTLLGKKLYYFLNSIEIPNNGSFYLYEKFSKILTYLPLGFWILGPLGLFGLWLGWTEKKGVEIIIFIILYTILIVLFFVCDRFRLPVIPFLAIYAGRAVERIYDLFKNRLQNKLIRWGISLTILFVIVNSNITGFQKGNIASDNFAIGNLELAAGNYKNAIAYYEKIPTDKIAIQDVHLNWGTAEWRLGNYDKAIQQFHKEYSLFPESYDALANLAHLYTIKGKPEEAIWYSQRAIRLKPYSPIAYVDLAIALTDLGHFDRAESTLLSYLQMYPEDRFYEESVLAGIQIMQNKIETAENTYRSILSRLRINRQPIYEPEYQYSSEYRIGGSWKIFQANIYYSLGHIFVKRQNQDSAIAYFKKAIELHPRFGDAWIDLGTSQYFTGDLVTADSSLRTGLRFQPENYRGWYNYGILMLEKNNVAEAELAFRRAISINPDFLPALKELSELKDKK